MSGWQEPLIFLLLIGKLAAGFFTWERLISLVFWESDLYYVGGTSRLFPESWFDWLAVVLSRVELDGVWPEGLLDAYITMIPEATVDATPLGQRPLCVLPVVYRIWASVRLRHLDGWLRSWLPLSVFSAGGG